MFDRLFEQVALGGFGHTWLVRDYFSKQLGLVSLSCKQYKGFSVLFIDRNLRHVGWESNI